MSHKKKARMIKIVERGIKWTGPYINPLIFEDRSQVPRETVTILWRSTIKKPPLNSTFSKYFVAVPLKSAAETPSTVVLSKYHQKK